MSMSIVGTGVSVYSSISPLTAAEFDFPFPTTIDIPIGLWLQHATIVPVIIVRFSTTVDNPSYEKKRQFRNPDRRTIGQYSLLSDGYVVGDGKLEYLKQQLTYQLPPHLLEGTIPTLPLRLALNANSKESHSYSISGTPICGTVTSQTVPAPAPTQGFTSATIPPGAICLRSFPAETHYYQESSILLPAPHRLPLELGSAFLPDYLSGILYVGYSLQIQYTIGYYTLTNQQAPLAEPAAFVGGSPYPIYGYGCALGEPVPAPSNPPCPPGSIRVTGDGGTGFYTTCATNPV